QRLDCAVSSAVAGSGIGLAVVAELVSLHGGRAWVGDAPACGARVVVELPQSGPGSREAGDDSWGESRGRPAGPGTRSAPADALLSIAAKKPPLPLTDSR